MFDQTPQTNWQHDIAIGDVVLFRFPTIEDRRKGEVPERRPCLVVETPRLGAHRFAKLAYGTSACWPANRGSEVFVRHMDAVEAAGLNRPSRFMLDRALLASLAHSGFEADAHGDPRIGHLDPALMQRLHALRARMHAVADIAADRRKSRLNERYRWWQEGREAAKMNRDLLEKRSKLGA